MLTTKSLRAEIKGDFAFDVAVPLDGLPITRFSVQQALCVLAKLKQGASCAAFAMQGRPQTKAFSSHL